MWIISFKAARDFWENGHAEAKEPLKKWRKDIRALHFLIPQNIKDTFSTASFIGHDRIVFNISGNKYRLVVHVKFRLQKLYIRFIGTHAEYDKINAEEI